MTISILNTKHPEALHIFQIIFPGSGRDLSGFLCLEIRIVIIPDLIFKVDRILVYIQFFDFLQRDLRGILLEPIGNKIKKVSEIVPIVFNSFIRAVGFAIIQK